MTSTQRWGGIFGAQRKGRVPLRTVQNPSVIPMLKMIADMANSTDGIFGKVGKLLLDFAQGDS